MWPNTEGRPQKAVGGRQGRPTSRCLADPPYWVMKSIIFKVLVAVGAFCAGATVVSAAINFGSGYYTNLCGSGTVATFYNCDSGCDPRTGICSGASQGVVKYVCSGKWDQCLESETGWTNREEIGSVSCGKTVQISVFDKKCRKEDGSWDLSCELLGYMVWYSGDCRSSITPTQATPRTTVVPTGRPTVLPTSRPSITPTRQPSPTAASKINLPTSIPKVSIAVTPTPTSVAVVAVCGKKCATDVGCQAGFVCSSGVCRNPSCSLDETCFCGQVSGSATGSAVAKKSPETGFGMIEVGAGLTLVAGVGILLKRISKLVW